MLDPDSLKRDISGAISQIIPPAIEVCMRSTFSELTDQTEELCSDFAKRFDDMVSKPLGERLGDLIDQYLKSACIWGNILTAGSPVTQTAIINPGGVVNVANPVAGAVPNVLGIK